MTSVTSIAEYRERRSCGHLHDTTTRYDHARKLLSFLLVCSVCNTEKLLERQRYEPRFIPMAAPAAPLCHAA